MTKRGKRRNYMKIKKGSLLTAILSLLCAVAFAIGIAIALPKNGTVADADGEAAAKSWILKNPEKEIKFSTPEWYYYEDPAGPNGSLSIADMSAEGLNSGSPTANDTSVSFTQGNISKDGKMVYVDIPVKVKVPAWEEWKISFKVSFSLNVYSTLPSGFSMSAGALYFKPDTDKKDEGYPALAKSSELSFSTNAEASPINGTKIEHSGVGGPKGTISHTHDMSQLTITLTNKTDKEKEFTFNFGMYGGAGYSSAQQSKITSLSANLKDRKAEVTRFWVPAPDKDTKFEYDYDENDKSDVAAQDIEKSDWYTRENDKDYTPGDWAEYKLPENGMINVVKNGTKIDGYEVSYTLKDPTNHPFKFKDGTITKVAQKFKIIINPIEPENLVVIANKEDNKLFTSNKLSDVTIELDGDAATNPKGKVAWRFPNTKLTQGSNEYEFKFTSEDNNYKDTTGKITLEAGGVELAGIKAEYTQGTNTIYPSTDVTKGLPGTLKVTKIATDGSTLGSAPLSSCTYEIAGALTVGENTVTVKYTEDGNEYSAEVTINVTAAQLKKITAVLNTGSVVYESTTMTQLAQMLTVTAEYNDCLL